MDAMHCSKHDSVECKVAAVVVDNENELGLGVGRVEWAMLCSQPCNLLLSKPLIGFICHEPRWADIHPEQVLAGHVKHCCWDACDAVATKHYIWWAVLACKVFPHEH